VHLTLLILFNVFLRLRKQVPRARGGLQHLVGDAWRRDRGAAAACRRGSRAWRMTFCCRRQSHFQNGARWIPIARYLSILPPSSFWRRRTPALLRALTVHGANGRARLRAAVGRFGRQWVALASCSPLLPPIALLASSCVPATALRALSSMPLPPLSGACCACSLSQRDYRHARIPFFSVYPDVCWWDEDVVCCVTIRRAATTV